MRARILVYVLLALILATIHLAEAQQAIVAEPRFITSVLDVVSAVSASERIDHFRAYRKYPELDLPTTTGSVEAMNPRVRDLMRQTPNTSSSNFTAMGDCSDPHSSNGLMQW